MEKKIVLDKKEISKLKELRQNFTNLTNTLGNLEISKRNTFKFTKRRNSFSKRIRN